MQIHRRQGQVVKSLASAAVSLALALPLSATADETLPVIYLGTKAGDPPASVAVLLVNSKAANNGTLRCNVAWVIPDYSEELDRRLDRTTAVVIRPGRFDINAIYTGLRSGAATSNHTFKAGKRYKVDCDGQSFKTINIAIEEF